MKILAKEKISEHKYKTPEGYLICVDSVLARTGKQTYTRDELFHDGDDREIEVDRTPEEVFSDATLASFENKPLVVEHPDEDVNSANNKEYAVGFVRDVKRGDLNGEPVMLGTLVITDEETIKEIENGEHTDLSCGYDCDIEDEANPSQRNIRGNHVALCQTGRAGIAKIVDSVKDNMATAVIKWWKKVEKWNNTHGRKFHIDNDESKIGEMLIAMPDMYNEKELINSEPYLAKEGRAIYNKYKYEKWWNDSVKDGVRLPNDIRKDLSRILAHKSTFTKRDVDVVELIKELERYFRIDGKKVTFTREGIKGWYRTGDGTLRKDYKFSVDGYDNSDFMISLYADEDYKTTEINAYMLDSIKDSKFEEYMRKLAYIDEYWQVSKMLERAYNELGLDEYKRLREAAEKRKKEILTMHDSNTNDKLIESGSEEAFKKNIATEIRAGKDPKQAAAIAYSVQRENDSDTEVEDERTSMEKEVEKAISGLKSKVFNQEFTYENNRGFASLTIRRKYGIDPKSKPIVELYVEQDAREIDRRLKTIPGYDVKVVSATISKERYSDPGAGLNFERIALFGRKKAATDSVDDEIENLDVKDQTAVPFDALKDAPSKGYAITKIKEIIKNPRYTSEDNEGVRYLTQEGYKLVQQLAKSNGLDRRDMEAIDWYMFGPGGYPSIVDSDEKVEDAMEKYYIRWIDQYSKQKGWDKSFWLYDDEVKANSAKEALDKLANIAVQRGVGTRYVTIVNIKTDKTSYQVSGNIDDLRKRKLDSVEDEESTYTEATKKMEAGYDKFKEHMKTGDSKRVGKYKVTRIK